ncbi:hypothetical protein DICPUDRAFT_154579 [Dictyostelium purpureum]|uniref:Kinesin-like protein n=1 Tax=Dictyostelium purpureum TaxID=5786 RepID=F0ZRQ0_DICPU|nr:uncharacterized protein DICPUDRAFT_154579 [Dictyostelium purpureum]EGC33388.1 hypothetical protein DICPUDRAFT_154579 [Dictyostelium purpureum]|eukprot:XP_003290096.1 hypothetical protein DICPUDRAFT_154579 [Dictyostelium purpureum]
MSSVNIRVFTRFRPMNDREKALKENQQIIQFPDETQVVINYQGAPIPFTFDRVFPPDSTQEEVFNSLSDTITDVLKGYNGTIFAYGQTGSGKTYTMNGPDDKSDVEQLGIIPRANNLIFNSIAEDTTNSEFTIKCSYLEIYMESIQDLLNPKNNKNLKIRESKAMGIYIEGLAEEFVACEEDVMDLMELGDSSRSVAKTNMNHRSSRSHSILILTIEQKSTDGSKKRGKLNLVDLAGSEKVSKTGAEGQTLEEAKKINQSLSLLGNCIHALTDSKRDHIPFRDSKLTRLLQDSLGGNTKTTLLVTASPHCNNVEETISTLKFGARAKTIKNSVKVNQEKSAAELQIIVNALTKELNTLKAYSISLENLVNYFKSPSYQPGQSIPKELEPNKQNLLLLQAQQQQQSQPSTANGVSGGIPPLRPRSTTPTPQSSRLSSSSTANNRHSVAITGSHSSSGNTTPTHGLTSSMSSSSLNSLASDDFSIEDDQNGLFNPLAVVEMSMEIEKMKEETQLLIDKFKDEISEITIKYESVQDELMQARVQLDQTKEQAELTRSSFVKEQSALKESERNLSLDVNSKDQKIQVLIQKIEDLRLLASQVIQYLERKRSSDDFDMGVLLNSQISSSGPLNSSFIDEGTYEDDINIEDIIRYLSEEEVLSMQIKIQLQNKVHQLEQKINQVVQELNSAEQSLNSSIINCQKLESENSIIKRKFKSMFSSNNSSSNNGSMLKLEVSTEQPNQDPMSPSPIYTSPIKENNIQENGATTENEDINDSSIINDQDMQGFNDEFEQKLIEESSKTKELELKLQNEIKLLKLQNEKNNEELNKAKDELSIKSALYQNQILNLQNENQTLQNKLSQEKQHKQSSQSQQLDIANKLNELIKKSETESEEFRSERKLLLDEIGELKENLNEMELKTQDLQDQLTSTQRLLNSRRAVKIVRGGADSLKTALSAKVEFGQHTLKKTGKSLF